MEQKTVIEDDGDYLSDSTINVLNTPAKNCNKLLLSGFGIAIQKNKNEAKEFNYCLSKYSLCCNNDQLKNFKKPLMNGIKLLKAQVSVFEEILNLFQPTEIFMNFLN